MTKKILILTLILLAFAIPCHAQGVVVFGSTDPPVNLLTNSGFDVWSNSTLAQGTTGVQSDFEYGSAEHYDDCEDDETASYEKFDCTLVHDVGTGVGASNCYKITETGATQWTNFYCSGLIVGHDYKFSLYVKNGTYTLTALDTIQSRTNAGSTICYTPLATSAAWADFSVIWRATETNNRVSIYLNMGAGETIYIDEFRVIEVTPGCVGADVLACDGWFKDSTLDVFREPNGTNTKNGSYYGLTCKPGATNDYVGWPNYKDKSFWLERCAGKKMVFGAWVKTDSSSTLKARFYDGSFTYSQAHSGGGSWEWLEVTTTVSSTPSAFQVEFSGYAGSGTFYISQPVLTYGSTINQGQYYPSNKIITLEDDIASHKFDGSATVSDGSGVLYLGGDSSAKLPYGAKALKIRSGIKDTGSAGTDCYFYAGYYVSACIAEYINSPYGRANSSDCYVEGWTSLNADGDFEYTIEEGTVMTISDFEYTAVEVR